MHDWLHYVIYPGVAGAVVLGLFILGCRAEPLGYASDDIYAILRQPR